MTEDIRNLKHCLICGCTEHRLIGCHTHWSDHKKNKNGKCEIKDQ